jgi:hypothetical protein
MNSSTPVTSKVSERSATEPMEDSVNARVRDPIAAAADNV